MHTLFNKKNRGLVYIFIAINTITLSTIILLPYGQLGVVLLSLLILVSFISIFFGPIHGLGFSLILLFFVGSLLFWLALTQQTMLDHQIPMTEVFIWMVLLVLISLLTGYSSHHINYLYKENKELEEKIRSLIALDPVTGFDNKSRMFIELKSQFNRSKQYGHTYSFLIMKINHFEQFLKLYGKEENTNMLKYIAKQMVGVTRGSDLHFRIEKDTFAILFTDTPIKDIDIIIRKLNKELQVFQLQNNRLVTITFDYGYASFEDDISDYLRVYEIASEQVASNAS